jgi:hypothetical protein
VDRLALLSAPDLPEAEILCSVRLMMALAGGLGMQMLANDDHEQTRRDTLEAGAMIATYVRARHDQS